MMIQLAKKKATLVVDSRETAPVASMILNLIDHKRVLQESVDAPRIAQTSANGATRRELGFSDDVIAGVLDLGHALRDPGNIGSMQAIAIDEDKRQFGAADGRRTGGAVSVRRAEIRPAAIKQAARVDRCDKAALDVPAAYMRLSGRQPSCRNPMPLRLFLEAERGG